MTVIRLSSVGGKDSGEDERGSWMERKISFQPAEELNLGGKKMVELGLP